MNNTFQCLCLIYLQFLHILSGTSDAKSFSISFFCKSLLHTSFESKSMISDTLDSFLLSVLACSPKTLEGEKKAASASVSSMASASAASKLGSGRRGLSSIRASKKSTKKLKSPFQGCVKRFFLKRLIVDKF